MDLKMTAINGRDSLGDIFAQFDTAILSLPTKLNEIVITVYIVGFTMYLWVSGRVVCENCGYRWKLSDLIVEKFSVFLWSLYTCMCMFGALS
jgi:hypothetical protein